MYRSYVLPGPTVAFALGLYVIAALGGSSVDAGSRDVLTLCWGQEEYILALVYLLLLFGTVGSKYCF